MAARPRFSSTAQMMRAAAALRRAVAAAGGAARLAQQLSLHATTVNGWTFCPAGHVDTVAVATGVSRNDLRPDLSPRALTAEQAVAAHLAAGGHFARTGRCLSMEVR
ncbi:YdaS family helix-turn-helix protein [Methylobacterium pseudosasicola]|uniref:Putative antitoxin of toxin-antitoxin system, YdaS/YdaT n=1 Tax=Methylobacterium pseudosasicola TaxID=582667 RepID=A0A1I4URH5_9HYPH|nr:YdaS family helix-turn-helix protein [Methylobacterium pseudosasicola]SFM91566.1 Putative antitoxin of toxin-antitoxin system, YdaS/YdaT [Methylobacterium pseudosasicola]